jgi:hypothetical protein
MSWEGPTCARCGEPLRSFAQMKIERLLLEFSSVGPRPVCADEETCRVRASVRRQQGREAMDRLDERWQAAQDEREKKFR